MPNKIRNKNSHHFLGNPSDGMVKKLLVRRRKANERGFADRSVGYMMEKSRRLLDEYYSPWNQRLAQLLANDKFLWQDVK